MPQVAQTRRDPMAQCHSISECQTQSYCPDCVSRSISLADKADAYRSIILVKEVKVISIDRLFVFILNSYKTESNLELALNGRHIRLSKEATGRTVLIFPQAGGLCCTGMRWKWEVSELVSDRFQASCLQWTFVWKYGNWKARLI